MDHSRRKTPTPGRQRSRRSPLLPSPPHGCVPASARRARWTTWRATWPNFTEHYSLMVAVNINQAGFSRGRRLARSMEKGNGLPRHQFAQLLDWLPQCLRIHSLVLLCHNWKRLHCQGLVPVFLEHAAATSDPWSHQRGSRFIARSTAHTPTPPTPPWRLPSPGPI